MYCNLSSCLNILCKPFHKFCVYYKDLLHSCNHAGIVVCRRITVFLKSSCKSSNEWLSHNQKTGKRANFTRNSIVIRCFYPGIATIRTSGIINLIRVFFRYCNSVPGRPIFLVINIKGMSDILRDLPVIEVFKLQTPVHIS
ncbi:hypothetical protein SDC9_204381 [bioreactor metagenome]|uniref:Uncharacterized protein n=1 Tax=bioreactor metagenome TaxID=1076179 RepID=A0A645J0K7_9ZZZZ